MNKNGEMSGHTRMIIWTYKFVNARRSRKSFWTDESLDLGVFERMIVWTWMLNFSNLEREFAWERRNVWS